MWMRNLLVLATCLASTLACGDSSDDTGSGAGGASSGGSGGSSNGGTSGSGGSATGGSGNASGGTAGSGNTTSGGGSAGTSSGGAAGSPSGGAAGTASGGSAGASPGDCESAADCGGQTCCLVSQGGSSTHLCVASIAACNGLVLCKQQSECGNEGPCCPQGFCGGCD